MKRVLIVDDVNFLLEFENAVIKQLSKETGTTINVEEASSIEKALQKIAENDYDSMVLDINLPDGLGIDIAKAAREKNANTRIAMLTISPESYDQYREYFDVFMKKPVIPDTYKEVMRKMLNL